MSRASRRDNSTSASLFPFLAVLLCTMGVLVVLLVVMASVQLDQAERKQLAKQAAEAPQVDAAEQAKFRAELSELDDTANKLKQLRQELTGRLRDEEQRLSQIEENIRRRQEELALLRVAIDELNSLDNGNLDDLEQAKARLAKQQELIARTKQEIEQLKQEAEKHTKRYAIVPYEGRNGTRRQPIYIECRESVVIIQPEGIRLTPTDFNLSMGAGGPLPAAIRAAQRYYTDHGLSTQKQAYPLVVARPDATVALAVVRNTLSRANMQYGYELVEAECDLDFSAADPALSNEMQRAVENARLRMATQRQRAPGDYLQNEVESFVQGPSPIERVRAGLLPNMLSPIGARASQAMSSQLLFDGGSVDVDRIAAALDSAGSQSTQTGRGLPGWGMGNSSINRDRYAAADQARQRTSSAHAGSGSAAAAERMANNEGEPIAPGQQASESQVAGGSSPQPTTNSQQASNAGSQQPNASNATPGSQGGNADSTSAQTVSMKSKSGTPGGSGQSKPKNGVALVRTIHVQVEADRLVVRSSKRSVADRSVPLTDGGQQAASKFVEAIRGEIEGWGMAGQGLYWQPVLEMTVAPGGKPLADRLAAVLRQGGLDVRLAMLP